MGLLSKLTVTVLNLLIAISLSFAEECTNRRVYIRNLPAQFNADLLHRQTLTNPFLSPNPLFPHLSFNGIGPKTHKRTHSWYRTDHRLIEPFFHRRLLEYPCLVSDHKSADAIFLPYYIGLDSLRFLYAPEDADFDVNGHGLDLFQFLIKDSPEIWKRRGGADHFLVSGRSSWDFSRSPLNREEWGTTFLESPEFFNVTVLTPEARRWPWQEQAIPYLTSFHPASLIRFQNWINRAHHSNRSTLMLFAGSGRGGGGTGGDKINIRRSLYEECDTQPESCTLIDCSNAKCSDEPTRFIHPMLHSTFCLHPPGDTPTRRGVFDGMIAGCIPVFFDEMTAKKQYTWHLGGDDDYEDFSVFISKEEILFGGKRITEILGKITEENVGRMRERVLKLVPRIFYRRHGSSPELRANRDAFDLAVDGVLKKIVFQPSMDK